MRYCQLVAVLLSLLPVASSGKAVAQSTRLGFETLTRADDQGIPPGTVVIQYDGPIVAPMADDLRSLIASLDVRFDTIVLDLHSQGGQLDHVEKVMALLGDVRRNRTLNTMVRQGRSCLSACLLLFMQGEKRVAGSASVWLFHGPCPLYTNVPSADAAGRYLRLLRQVGVGEALLCELVDNQYHTKPGKFWLSGRELYERRGAGVITEMLPSWQPEEPIRPPFEPQLQHR